MEKLNELKEAFYPQYGTPGSRDIDVTARRKVIDENIEAVAEHIRALEQRAEDAAYAQLAGNVKEIEASYLRDIRMHVKTISDLQQRAEAAEAEAKHQLSVNILVSQHHQKLVAEHNALQAKLAELAKQEPKSWFTEDAETDKSATTYSAVVAERWRAKGWPVTPQFTRPAPAAGLAELVPGNDLLRVLDFAKFVIKCVRKNGEYAPLSSQEPDEIAAILRNIEEQTKC
ncbi:hypothetical protein [Pantoea agglomerans]|uniref:hypothetical protein n=1 Tax=Enterobacter agglomerans TaxID=549 RepID=UPI002413171C|nr:hypothetical protein [Pantoea agglomerans]